jgi:hypothetical protein
VFTLKNLPAIDKSGFQAQRGPSYGFSLATLEPFTVVVALGTFAMALRTVTDPDVWWHLRTGQLIWQDHAIFRTDPYSFTRFGQPWIHHEWLTDAIMYLIFRVGSWTALSVAFAALASFGFLLAYGRCKASPAIAAFLTVCGVTAAMPSLGVRPQVVSFLFASVALWILDRSQQRPRILFWMVPLTLVWVNMHAGYAIGVALILLYLIGMGLEMGLGSVTWGTTKARLRNLIITLGGCLAVIPLNPYGTAMYTYPFKTLSSPAMQSAIQEWSSPNFHELKHLPTLLLILALLALVAVKPQRLAAHEMLLVTAALAGSLLSVRHIPLLALVAIPILSELLQITSDKTRTADHYEPSVASAHIFANTVLVVAMLVFSLARVLQTSQGQSANVAVSFPQGAASFLTQQRGGERLLNPYDWGGYMIWKLYPEHLVFIDGRADVYTDALVNESVASYNLRGNWYDPIKKWDIMTALLPRQAPLVQGLKARGWTAIYADSQAVILRRPDLSR